MVRSAVSWALLFVALAVCGCGPHPPSRDTLDGWVGQADKATVRAELGMPSMSIPLADGTTEWRYSFGYEAVLEDGVGPVNEVCWDYTFTFDSAGVLRSWSKERCRSAADPLKRMHDEMDEDGSFRR